MGGAKAWMMERHERGYVEAPGDICANCVSDFLLKQWIAGSAVSTTCSLCGRKDEDAIAADMDEFAGVVLNGVLIDWNHPNTEGIAYESAEGGYQADVVDTYEVLYECEVRERTKTSSSCPVRGALRACRGACTANTHRKSA